MIETTLALALCLAPVLVLTRGKVRTAAGTALLVVAVTVALLADGARRDPATLTITHTTTAFVGTQIQPKAFVVDERTAPAWQWRAVAAGWLLLWGLCAVVLRARPAPPLGLPLLWSFAALAFVPALQVTAAPAPVALGPFPIFGPFDGFLIPAAYAGAVLLGSTHDRFLVTLAKLVLLVAVPRLVLAGMMAFATSRELGTWLDVHRIDFVATPLGQKPYEFASHSSDQLRVLVWFPQLMVLPLLTMLSAGGFAFAAHMFRAHQRQVPR